MEKRARRIVEDLFFLATCRRLNLLREIHAENRGIEELIGSAMEQIGPALFQVRHNDPSSANRLPPAEERQSPSFHATEGGSALNERGSVDLDAEILPDLLSRLCDAGHVQEVSVRPSRMLGLVHEWFLGKRLQATRSADFIVRTSAAARKAQGMFYTPEFVAEYIAEHALNVWSTSGKGAHFRPVRILDPACGCGIFLLTALDVLRKEMVTNNFPDFNVSGTQSVPDTFTPKSPGILEAFHGIDLDPAAVLAARRAMWLELAADHAQPVSWRRDAEKRELAEGLARNIRCGNALADEVPREAIPFDLILGNPPYRRELGMKQGLEHVASSGLGKWRSPRMDLAYYFIHRGLDLLKPGGVLSFILSAYWTAARGAEKLIGRLRDECRIEEIFLLDRAKVFAGVSGRHMILTLAKGTGGGATQIRRPAGAADLPHASRGSSPADRAFDGQKDRPADGESLLCGRAATYRFEKTPEQLFRNGRLDLEPPAADSLPAGALPCSPLGRLGIIRQGIAENPAAVTRRTHEAYGKRWPVGEGVFAMSPEAADRLGLSQAERALLRPYHDLCDLGRYFLRAEPSLRLIYATPRTCPEIDRFPAVRRHLERFRPIMEARRETRSGLRAWWQLHWPRDETLWKAAKILSIQMAARPAFVPAPSPVYVPFSVNVFVPGPETREHLNYFAALLNSRFLWRWFERHAKHRGAGLEINGHILAGVPIRRIDFRIAEEKARHDRLVALAAEMLTATRRLREAPAGEETATLRERQAQIDAEIDAVVEDLYSGIPSRPV